MNSFDDFPQPSSKDLARSHALSDVIRTKIEQQSRPISFSRYMDFALYYPEYGYYSASTNQFTSEGDFTTAPEISPLFAQCFAKQITQILNHLTSGSILEIGAGSGRFAFDLLSALTKENCQLEHYYIYEKSLLLRQQQQALLSKYPHFQKCTWLTDLPAEFEGIIIANEVLDALPFDCFRIVDNAIKERCVTINNSPSSSSPYRFDWQLTEPLSAELTNCVSEIAKHYSLSSGYESEINLSLESFITSLTTRLTKGYLLFADYGYGQREYYRPERRQGTLTCFYKHRKNQNPFLFPGLQDITAHVDFTRVAEIALAQACSLAGYTTQAAFLLSCGLIDLVTEQEKYLSPIEAFDLQQAIKLLILPNEMGEQIKIMALGKHIDLDLLGFNMQSEKRNL